MLMLGLQVVVADERPPALPSFKAALPCKAEGGTDDIVVCGARDPDRYRLKPLAAGYDHAASPPRAELKVGDAKLAATTQQVMVGTTPSNRIMLNVKIPF